MTIENVIKMLEKYGYTSIKSYDASFYWLMEQHWKGIPKKDQTDKKELRINFISKSKENQLNQLNFNLFEVESVYDKNILYYIPGRMHYYFAFGGDVSRIYRDDEMDLLIYDINMELSNRMGVDELRNIKLIWLGI
jgi:hypothetical protein